MRRILQILKSKSRFNQKFQIKLSKQIIVKRNVRCLNNTNIVGFIERNSFEKDLGKEGENIEIKKDSIIEFNSELDWEDLVLNSTIPVVVKFYADWNTMCRQLLTLFLIKMEEQKNFKLVKLNVEKNQEMVEKMGIDSIPTIFLVFKGKIIDSIIGFPDDDRLNEFFSSISGLVEIDNEENSIKLLLKEANDHIKNKQWHLSEQKLNKAFSYEKSKEKYGPCIKYGLAFTFYRKRDFEKAEKIIRELYDKFGHEIRNDRELKIRINKLQKKIMNKKNPYIQSKTALKNKNIESINKEDLEKKYYIALQYFEHSDFEKAVSSLIDILKINKEWGNKNALNLLLKIFNFLGSNNKISIDGKKSLSSILF